MTLPQLKLKAYNELHRGLEAVRTETESTKFIRQ